MYMLYVFLPFNSTAYLRHCINDKITVMEPADHIDVCV